MNPIYITISAKLFSELCISNFNGYIELSDSNLMQEVLQQDKEEVFLHIEKKTADNQQYFKDPLATYQIWNIKDWQVAYTKRLQDKAKSQKEREEWWKFKRNIEKLSTAIMKMTGLDREVCDMMAEKIVRTKPEKAFTNFGIELEK